MATSSRRKSPAFRVLLGLAAAALTAGAGVEGPCGAAGGLCEVAEEAADEVLDPVSLLQIGVGLRPARSQAALGNLDTATSQAALGTWTKHSDLQDENIVNIQQSCVIPDLPSFGIGVGLTVFSMSTILLILLALSGPSAAAKGAGVPPALGEPPAQNTKTGKTAGEPPAASPASGGGATKTGKTSKTDAASASAGPPKTKQMYALDGLRTLLISNVIMGHRFAGETLVLKLYGGKWWPLRGIQHPSMSFFMILSGFVRYQAAKQRPNFDQEAARTYSVRILARFVPAYYLSLVLIMFLEPVATAPADRGKPFIAWPMNALFLQTLFPVSICIGPITSYIPPLSYLPFSGNLVAWFTSAVVWSSLTFPLLYNFFRAGRRWGAGCKSLILAILAVVAVPVAMLFLKKMTVASGDASSTRLFDVENGHFLPYRFLEFVIGMLSAQLFDEFPQPWREWRGWAWAFDGSLASLLLLSWAPHPDYSAIGLWAARHTGFLLLWTLLMVSARGAVESPKLGGLLIRGVGCWPFASLAKYSFGAYIYQCAASGALTQLGVDVSQHGTLFLLPLVATWCVGVASEHLFEGPTRNAVESRRRGPVAVRK